MQTAMQPATQAQRDSAYRTDDARWAAVVAHERDADGAFFYAVSTTGVFCRPSCGSRLPRRENVTFFDTPEAARQAGFRDCKRCRPGGLPRDEAIVARACAVLDADPGRRITLGQLSDAVHVSPFHLQRVFKRLVGVSPHQYQAARRGATLRRALESGADVTRAALDAGFNSPSRLYGSAASELGMAPSAYRKKGEGMHIRYAVSASALGMVLVAATAKGICSIAFGDDKATLLARLHHAFAHAECVEDATKMAPFIAQIDAYLNGSRETFDLPLDVATTAFRQRVWDALQRIPYGETRSYTQIAQSLGVPRAVRAVASACASNPVALAIPCHRVVQKGGSLAGYRWGLERKAALLEAEARRGQGSGNAEGAARRTAQPQSADAARAAAPLQPHLDDAA